MGLFVLPGYCAIILAVIVAVLMLMPSWLGVVVKNAALRYCIAFVFVILGIGECFAIHNDKLESDRRHENDEYALKSVSAAYVIGVDFSDARLAEYHRRILDATISLRGRDGVDKFGDILQDGTLIIKQTSSLMPNATDGLANDIFRQAYLEIAYFASDTSNTSYLSENFLNPLDPNPDLFGAYRGVVYAKCYLRTVRQNCAIFFGPWSGQREATWQKPYGNSKVTGLASVLGGMFEFRIHSPGTRAPIYLDKLDVSIGNQKLYFVRKADHASREPVGNGLCRMKSSACFQGRSNIQQIVPGLHAPNGKDLARDYISVIPQASIDDVFSKFDHDCDGEGLDIPEARNEP